MRKFDATKDYYRVLGVREDAARKQIYKAYRAQARRRHPDLGGTDDAMRSLNEAYEVLTDNEAHKLYDAERRLREAYSISAPAFNAAAASRSGTLGIPYRDRRIVQLIGASAGCFALGLLLLGSVEDHVRLSADVASWSMRAVPLSFFGLGVVLAHSASKTRDQQSNGPIISFLGGRSAVKQGVIWALGFVALLSVLIAAYVR